MARGIKSAAVALTLVLLYTLLWRLRSMAYDDAYIHLRIAANLAQHGKAFWNPGERVMATSSPAWTLLISGGQFWSHPAWLVPLEALLLTACAVAAFLLSREVVGGRAWLHFVAGCCAVVVVLTSAIGQMETPLAMALLLAAACCFARGSRWGLPLLALASCTRLELLPLLAFTIVAAVVLKSRWDAVIAAVCVVAAFAGAVYAQFGALLPNSMQAKTIVYAYHRSDVLHQLVPMRRREELMALCVVACLLCVVAERVNAWRAGRTREALWIPAIGIAWGIIAMLEYISRSTPVFDWYRPIVWLPLTLGLLLARVNHSSPRPLRWTFEAARLLALVILIAGWMPALKAQLRGAIRGTPEALAGVDDQAGLRVQEYLAVGRALRTTCPQARLMTSEIGGLGYAFAGHVDDAFGIGTPRALAFQPLRSGARPGGIPAAFAAEIQPDIIVSYDVLDTELRQDAKLMAAYDLLLLPTVLHNAPTGADVGWQGSRHLDVFLKKNGACPNRDLASALQTAIM